MKYNNIDFIILWYVKKRQELSTLHIYQNRINKVWLCSLSLWIAHISRLLGSFEGCQDELQAR
jgi:hypothetical protein